MADAEVQAKKASSSNENKSVNTDKNINTKVLEPPLSAVLADGRKTSSKTTKTSPVTSAGNMNKEVLLVLKELNNNVNKQGSKIESLSKRVDELYYWEDYEESYSESHDPEQDFSEETDSSQSCEPPSKKQCMEDDIFKNLCNRYQTVEKCDNEINDNLTTFINTSFRTGVAEEALSDMLKDIHRPANCSALVKTKVNASIWRLLKPQTQSEDVKFQMLQNVLVKASINFAKLLDKDSVNLDSQSLEWGTTSLALLGQAYKLINNKRKECHRSDLDPRFYPLTSSSQPYTDNLYGDDINKNVRDIQDMSKLGKDIARNQPPQQRGGYYRRRGGRRGFSRGRGRGTYGQSDQNTAPPKNPRGGHKRHN